MESESTTAPHSLPHNVRVLGFSSLLNDVASEMIFPLMPQFLISVLGGSRLELGIIEGVADSVSSLLKLWSGAWTDRAGRRKQFVVFGYALAAVARPLTGVATLPWHLFATRTGDRFGKGIRAAPRDALIADATDPSMRGRAFGFNRAMDHLGAAIGPVLASLFLWAWPGQLRTLFLLTLIPGLCVVALVAFCLRETPVASPTREPLRLTLRPFGWNFRLYLLALVLFTLGNSSDAFLLVRAKELGVSTAALPLLWCVFHVVKSGGNALSGRVVDRIGPRPLLLAGWCIYAAIYLVFAAISTAWQVWATFLAYGVFFALTEPAEKTLVTVLVGRERTGLAFGWFNFAIGVAALPSSLIFGWIYDRFGAVTAFGWGGSLALAAALLLAAVPMKQAAQ